MDKTTVKITIPWESEDKTLKQVFEVFAKNLGDAVRLNANNYAFLEEIRKDLVFGLMEVEALQANLKYSDIMNEKSNGNRGI